MIESEIDVMTYYLDARSYSTSLIMKKGSVYTVITEGESDKKIYNYIINELKNLGKCRSKPIIIDSVDKMIKQKSTGGNRGVVIEVANICFREGSDLIGVIDREFDHFSTHPIIDNHTRHSVSKNLYKTRGHSVENYLFDEKYYRDCITTLYSQYLNAIDLDEVERQFPNLVVWLSAMTLSAKNNRIIGRIKEGIFDESCWIINTSGTCEPNFRSILSKLNTRGVDTLIQMKFQIDAMAYYADIESSRSGQSDLRRFIHGHIGIEGLFSASAVIIGNASGNTSLAKDIATKNKDLRDGQLAKAWLSDNGYSKLITPFINWMVRVSS